MWTVSGGGVTLTRGYKGLTWAGRGQLVYGTKITLLMRNRLGRHLPPPL